MRRHSVLLGALLVLVAAATLLYARLHSPGDDATAGPTRSLRVDPAATFVNARASMAYFEERLRKGEATPDDRVALAQLHLQQARTTGREAVHVATARELLDGVLDRDPSRFDALALKASLLNTLHRFDDARAIAEALLARNPHHGFTHGVLVDALVETGAYEDAARACDRLLALRPGLPAYTRAAYLRELHGDVDGAIAAMRLAADAGVPGHEDRTWALHNLADLYLGQARLDTAAFLFDGILAERPGYAPALAGLGRVALARHDFAGAADRFEEAYAVKPDPAFLEGLADARDEAGDHDGARRARLQVRAALEEARAAGEDVDMELADFLAEHGPDRRTALRLAERAYARRPDHVHVLETLAWALYRNGRAVDAVPYVERALRLGQRDAHLHYRAARIYAAAGRADAAARHLEKSLRYHLAVEQPALARAARASIAPRTPAP